MTLRQRMPRYEDEKLRNLTRRAAQCYLRFDGCLGDGSLGPAHSNLLRHGRGKDYKTHDVYCVPACMACNRELDHGKNLSREEKEEAFMRAWESWMLVIFMSRLVRVI